MSENIFIITMVLGGMARTASSRQKELYLHKINQSMDDGTVVHKAIEYLLKQYRQGADRVS